VAAFRRILMDANNTGSDLWAALAARDPIMGIDAVGLRDMYERAVNYYGEFAQSDLVQIREKMGRSFNPKTEDMQAAMGRIREGCALYERMRQPIHEPEQLQILYSVLRPAHQSFNFYIQTYNMKTHKTLEKAITFMELAWTAIQNESYASHGARVESAHVAEEMITVSRSALQQMLKTGAPSMHAATIQSPTASSVPAPKKQQQLFYCWSHGVGNHDGANCNNRKEGHQTGPHVTLATAGTHGGSVYVRTPRPPRGDRA
jgi:hypothetical protein